MIDSWASSIHDEHPFALEVVVIGDQLTYLKVPFYIYVFLELDRIEDTKGVFQNYIIFLASLSHQQRGCQDQN